MYSTTPAILKVLVVVAKVFFCSPILQMKSKYQLENQLPMIMGLMIGLIVAIVVMLLQTREGFAAGKLSATAMNVAGKVRNVSGDAVGHVDLGGSDSDLLHAAREFCSKVDNASRAPRIVRKKGTIGQEGNKNAAKILFGPAPAQAREPAPSKPSWIRRIMSKLR